MSDPEWTLTLHYDVEGVDGLAVGVLGLALVLALVLLLDLLDVQDLPMILHDGSIGESVAHFDPLNLWSGT